MDFMTRGTVPEFGEDRFATQQAILTFLQRGVVGVKSTVEFPCHAVHGYRLVVHTAVAIRDARAKLRAQEKP